MKLITISGSLRPSSTTGHALAAAAQAAADAGAEVRSLSLDALDLPFCDGRSDESTYGESTLRFREQVTAARGLIIGSPNYHGSFTGVLKNALDLLGPEAMRDKLVGLVVTARGEAGGMNTLNHLRHVCRWMNAWVIPAEVCIPTAQNAFDSQGQVLRPELNTQLETLGTELVRYAGLLKG
jgi:NAD(P)H-dependent FMN reductase